jgi:hypothetical protein
VTGSAAETQTIVSTVGGAISGTLDGGSNGGNPDTLQLTDSDDISGATISNLETVDIEANATVSMGELQHDGFSTFTDNASQSITLTSSDGDDALTGNSNIESYTLNDAITFTLGAADQDVTGSAAETQTIVSTVGGAISGTLDGGDGAGNPDTLQLTDSDDISGATISNFESLDISGTVTMTVSQLGSIDYNTAGSITGNNSTISLSDALFASALDSVMLPNGSTLDLHDASNTLTTKDGLVTNGEEVTIDGSGLTGANDLTFDGAIEDDGSYIVKGGAAADNITGSQEADTINGNGGGDTITGGDGADTIDVGAGGSNDHVVYNAASEGGATGDDVSNLIFTGNEDDIDIGGTLEAAIDTEGDDTFEVVEATGEANGPVTSVTTDMLFATTAISALASADAEFTGEVANALNIMFDFTTAPNGTVLATINLTGANEVGLYAYTEAGGSTGNDAVDAGELQILGVSRC